MSCFAMYRLQGGPNKRVTAQLYPFRLIKPGVLSLAHGRLFLQYFFYFCAIAIAGSGLNGTNLPLGTTQTANKYTPVDQFMAFGKGNKPV